MPPPELVPPGTEPWLPPGTNSVVLLPVIVEGTAAALVTASASGDRPPLGQPETELLGLLLEQACTPLSSALEYQRTKQVALALQRSLLTEPPDLSDLELALRYRPSNAAAEVGGDWYDSFEPADGVLVLTIGDVTGHDLPTAVTMSQLRTMLRGLALDRQEATGAVLRRLACRYRLSTGNAPRPASWAVWSACPPAGSPSTTPWPGTRPHSCSRPMAPPAS